MRVRIERPWPYSTMKAFIFDGSFCRTQEKGDCQQDVGVRSHKPPSFPQVRARKNAHEHQDRYTRTSTHKKICILVQIYLYAQMHTLSRTHKKTAYKNVRSHVYIHEHPGGHRIQAGSEIPTKLRAHQRLRHEKTCFFFLDRLKIQSICTASKRTLTESGVENANGHITETDSRC